MASNFTPAQQADLDRSLRAAQDHERTRIATALRVSQQEAERVRLAVQARNAQG